MTKITTIAVLIQGKGFILRYNNLMKVFTRFEGEKSITGNIPFKGWLVIILLAGVLWKVWWLANDAFPFNSDEAITGLMARHILQGESPVFFYGQAYMGSLDAFLTAGLFCLFGDSYMLIRILQILLFTCTIITTAWLGRIITHSREAALVTALLLAFPAVNVTLYTTVSLGGYGEALVLSNCAFLCTTKLHSGFIGSRHAELMDWFFLALLGLISGLGFWVLGLTLVATVPATFFGLYSVWQRRNTSVWLFPVGLLVYSAFFLIGSYPWLQTVFQSGLWKPIQELLGSAVSVEQGNWFERSGRHVIYFILFGLPAIFGFRPPWEVRWLSLPLLPFVLILWGVILWRFTGMLKKTNSIDRRNWFLLISSMGVLVAGFIFTSFGLDPSGRYFLPLAVPLSLIAGWVLVNIPWRREIRWGVIILLVVYHMIGTAQSALKNPPGITTQFDPVSWIDHRFDQTLMDFLRSEGETRGYTNYWVAYPLAFKSREELLFSPRLPYHTDLRYTPRDDRIPAYTQQVNKADRVAYITTRNMELDTALKTGFRRMGVEWKEKVIGDYHVFYRLSQPVRPEELQIELLPRISEKTP